MPYMSRSQLEGLGFASIGRDVKISDRASIYGAEEMSIGDYSRIDDFCVVSGKVFIGRNVYIGPFGLIAGGIPGIVFEDFSTLAYGVQVFTQSDDYSGMTLTNPTVPRRFKSEIMKPIRICRHSIIGAGTIITPGVTLAEGTSVGTASMLLTSTEPWSIYVGSPAKKLKDRKRDLLLLEKAYLLSDHGDQK